MSLCTRRAAARREFVRRSSDMATSGATWSARPQAIETEEAREQRVERQRQHQQDEAERSRHLPVQVDIDVVGDEVADELIACTADERRRDVVAEAENEG